jgi:hypothetical protein
MPSSPKGGTNMKRVGQWAVVIGVLTSVGLLTVERGFTEEREHATKCTLATLEGRYLFALTGTLFPPDVTAESVIARAGSRIFFGDGTGTFIATMNVNGITTADAHGDLSYTVNADCTGTLQVVAAGARSNQELFIAPNGDSMTAIATGPGIAEAYSSWRVGRE